MSELIAEDYELFHHGVKGMKWGVRRTDAQLKSAKQPSARRQRYNELLSAEQRIIEVKTKTGKTVRAVEEPNSKLSAFISSLSKTGVEDNRNSPVFKIEAEGKRVGEAIFNKKSSEEINLVWLGVKESERGQGYASAIFDAAVNHGKQEGVSKLTLEVPGNAPDARHIYEKRGFKVTKEPSAKEIRSDSIWGGLTHMELDLTRESIRHSAISVDEELEMALIQTFTPLTPEQEKVVYGETSIKHAEDYELFHYGVKGMKWGVIRKEGPDGRVVKKAERAEAKQTKRDTKAKKLEDRGSAYRQQIDSLRAKPSKSKRSDKSREKLIGKYEELETKALRDAQAKKDGKLTSGQKKLLIGAGVVAVAVGATVTYKTIQSGEANRLLMKGKAAIQGADAGTWKRNERLARKDLDADTLFYKVAARVNPDYGKPGTKVNCRRCTFAYEMSRRGYDVAATKTTNGSGQAVPGIINATTKNGTKIYGNGMAGAFAGILRDEMSSELGTSQTKPFVEGLSKYKNWGENKIERTKASSIGPDIFNSLATQPDGARGELGMKWTAGGGHSMAWEIVGGKPVIFDTQVRRKYTSLEDIEKLGNDIAEAGFTRLDNKELNEDFLRRWVKNA